MSPISLRRKTIRSEKTLGEQLRAARDRLNYTLDEAEKATRVRSKYLVAFEDGRFDELPEDVYTFGYMRRYAHFLGIDAGTAIQTYRGERLAAERLGWVPAQPALHTVPLQERLIERSVLVTPKLFWFGTSLVVVVSIAGYLWYQVHGFLAAPALEVAAPIPEMIVSNPTIEVLGKTDAQASVTINAEPIAIDADGAFRQEIRLEQGMNTIEVAAKNRLNKETKKHLRVLATYNEAS